MRFNFLHLNERTGSKEPDNYFDMRSIFDDDVLPEPGSVLATAEKAVNQGTEKEQETLSELDEARWAVVSFDHVEALAMTYDQAIAWMEERERQGVKGLCIVTNEAAARVPNQRFRSSYR